MKPSLLLLALVLFCNLHAQTPTYKQVLDGLAMAAPTAQITLPAAFFAQPETENLGKLQRGLVLYAAGGRAKELRNHERSPVLIAGSRAYLEQAYAGLSSSENAPKSQAAYTLGMICEFHQVNLALAKSYYQAAVNLQSSNQPAQNALARVTRLQQGNP